MNFQENLFGSVLCSHWCNWYNLKCGWSNASAFAVYCDAASRLEILEICDELHWFTLQHRREILLAVRFKLFVKMCLGKPFFTPQCGMSFIFCSYIPKFMLWVKIQPQRRHFLFVVLEWQFLFCFVHLSPLTCFYLHYLTLHRFWCCLLAY